jgi:cation transport ATPase
MSYFEQLMNSTKYALHKATYNPEAEKYAKQQQKAAEKLKQDAEAETTRLAEKAKKEQEAKQQAEEAAEKERIAKERAEFSGTRLIGRILKTIGIIVAVALLLIGGVYGASLATNLNVYKSAPFRILYAIWGFLFFWVVIPYVWIYRRFWLHKTPRFYAILPLVPYHFNHPIMSKFFDWITFNPEEVTALKEWRNF